MKLLKYYKLIHGKLILLICAIGFLVQSTTVLKKYLKYPFMVDVTIKYYDEDYLPAITLKYKIRDLPDEIQQLLDEIRNPNSSRTTLDPTNDEQMELINELHPNVRVWRKEDGSDSIFGIDADLIPTYKCRFDQKWVYQTFSERNVNKRQNASYYFTAKSYSNLILFAFTPETVKTKSHLYHLSLHPFKSYHIFNSRHSKIAVPFKDERSQVPAQTAYRSTGNPQETTYVTITFLKTTGSGQKHGKTPQSKCVCAKREI